MGGFARAAVPLMHHTEINVIVLPVVKLSRPIRSSTLRRVPTTLQVDNMPPVIAEFIGQYRWLSNFADIPGGIVCEGIQYSTSEHAFQALKSESTFIRQQVAACKTPGEAKRFGRKLALRPEWRNPNFRIKTMYQVLLLKFSIESFRSKLLQTGNSLLIEGNTWGDCFWGVDLKTKQGHNHLGRLLMRIRKEITTTC